MARPRKADAKRPSPLPTAPINEGGRPREHDRDDIARQLIEWAKRDDSLNLNGFCCTREHPLTPSKITEWARECKKFRLAYEFAKTFLAIRREQKLGTQELHIKAYDLNATVYDQFLRDERRDQMQFEANLKSETQQETEQDKAEKEALYDSIIAYQKRQIDLRRNNTAKTSELDAGADKA